MLKKLLSPRLPEEPCLFRSPQSSRQIRRTGRGNGIGAGGFLAPRKLGNLPVVVPEQLGVTKCRGRSRMRSPLSQGDLRTLGAAVKDGSPGADEGKGPKPPS